jgi:hypothetical protein
MKKILFTIICFLFIVIISIGQKSKKPVLFDSILNKPFIIRDVSSFSDGNKVWLSWRTENESEILGYNVFRSNGSLKKRQVNAGILPGSALSSNGRIEQKDYSYIDSEGSLLSVYYIETIDTKGNRSLSNPIYPQYTNNFSSFNGDNLNASASVINEKTINPPDAVDQLLRASLMNAAETQKWIAAQPGVKIAVNREGFYRISKATLQAAGFDTSSNEANWQLYVDGVEQAFLLNPTNIEFYGTGIDTISTDKRIYYLVSGTTAGKRIPSVLRRQIRGLAFGKSFDSSVEVKDKLFYASGILNGDADNYFGQLIIGSNSTPTPTNTTINIPSFDPNTEKTDLQISIQPLGTGNHTIQVKFNGQVIDTITGQDMVLINKQVNVPSELINSGNNTVQFVAQGGSSDINSIVSLKFLYKRKYEAIHNQLNFYTQHYQMTRIDGFTSSNVRVFDIADATTPKLITNAAITQNGATFSATLLSNRTRSMFAVEESGIKTPVSVTANTPSTLSAGSRDANMIIISHTNFMAQANAWKTYRQGQGLTVEVVNIDDVFDEFGFGTNQPDNIRSFLQHVHSNWQNVKYVLFVGDATFDPRGYSGNPFANYIPTRLVDTVYLQTGSDETLADFNNDGLAEIAVGRIPVRDTTSLTTIFNKITFFESSVLNSLQTRGALFVSDEPNGYDFVGINTRIGNELPAGVPKSYTYKPDSTARTDTLNHLNNGKLIVNWSGHGNTAVWSSNSFINKTDMGALTNSNYTIFTLLTCLNGYYVEAGSADVFGEVALKNPNGGATAVWASSGLTTADIQEVMAKRFFYLLGNNPSFTRIGDLIKDSKTTIPFGRDVRLSWALLGDPSMKVK